MSVALIHELNSPQASVAVVSKPMSKLSAIRVQSLTRLHDFARYTPYLLIDRKRASLILLPGFFVLGVYNHDLGVAGERQRLFGPTGSLPRDGRV